MKRNKAKCGLDIDSSCDSDNTDDLRLYKSMERLYSSSNGCISDKDMKKRKINEQDEMVSSSSLSESEEMLNSKFTLSYVGCHSNNKSRKKKKHEKNNDKIGKFIVLSSDSDETDNVKHDSVVIKKNEMSFLPIPQDSNLGKKKRKKLKRKPKDLAVLSRGFETESDKIEYLKTADNCNSIFNVCKKIKNKIKSGKPPLDEEKAKMKRSNENNVTFSTTCTSRNLKNRHKKAETEQEKMIIEKINDQSDLYGAKRENKNKKTKPKELIILCSSDDENSEQNSVSKELSSNYCEQSISKIVNKETDRLEKIKDKVLCNDAENGEAANMITVLRNFDHYNENKSISKKFNSKSDEIIVINDDSINYEKKNEIVIQHNYSSISNASKKLKRKKKKNKSDKPLDDEKANVKKSNKNNEAFSATSRLTSRNLKNGQKKAETKQEKIIISNNFLTKDESCQNSMKGNNKKVTDQSDLYDAKRKNKNRKTKSKELIILCSSDDEHNEQNSVSKDLPLNSCKQNISKIVNEEIHKIEMTKDKILCSDAENCEDNITNALCNFNQYNKNRSISKKFNSKTDIVIVASDDDDSINYEEKNENVIRHKFCESEQYITLSDNSASEDEENLCVLDSYLDKNFRISTRTEKLLLQLEEEKVDFHIPTLHKREKVSNKKHELMTKDVIIRKGKFSKKEDSIILNNWESIKNKFCVDDPLIFLGIGNCKRKKIVIDFIKAKHFYVRLGRGLNDRTLKSIYERARILLLRPQIVSKFSSNEISKIQRLRNINGFSWVKIGQILGRTPNSCLMIYKYNKKPIKCGSWSNEEHQNLIQAIKTVMIESQNKNFNALNRGAIKSLTINSDFSLKSKDLKGISWTRIASLVPTRNSLQCWQHFHNVCVNDTKNIVEQV